MLTTLAEKKHDAGLRELMRAHSMPGWIRVAYCCDPSFFEALGVQGTLSQAVIAENNDQILGVGCRATKPLYINGAEHEFGYLGGLRTWPEARIHMALFRTYRYLRELHNEDGRTPAYLTTIMEDNEHAKRVLTSGRAGLPAYRDYGQYRCCAISISRRRRCREHDAVQTGTPESLPEIEDFLQIHGRQRQFFPVFRAAMLDTPYLRDLTAGDFLILREAGKITAVMALWNQSAFKQRRVEGYAPLAGMLRPLSNIMLRGMGLAPLPAPGEDLSARYASFVCVKNDDPTRLRKLLEMAYASLQRQHVHYLMIGFHERDPLIGAVSGLLRFTYRSRLYLVAWDDGRHFCDQLVGDRVPYLELGSL